MQGLNPFLLSILNNVLKRFSRILNGAKTEEIKFLLDLIKTVVSPRDDTSNITSYLQAINQTIKVKKRQVKRQPLNCI